MICLRLSSTSGARPAGTYQAPEVQGKERYGGLVERPVVSWVQFSFSFFRMQTTVKEGVETFQNYRSGNSDSSMPDGTMDTFYIESISGSEYEYEINPRVAEYLALL